MRPGGKANLWESTGWDNLSWGNIPHSPDVNASSEEPIRPGMYLSSRRPKIEGESQPDPNWDDGSAAIARITCQKPVRVAIHASQMIPKSSE